MKSTSFAVMFFALVSVNSDQEADWLWQFVDEHEKENPEVRKQILFGAKEITRLLLESKSQGEGEGEGGDEENINPSPPTQTPATPASAHPTPSPPTPALAQPTPSPPTSATALPTPSPPTPVDAQPTPSPPTSAARTAQPTPSPPAPLEFRTTLVEAVSAGDNVVQVENVTGFAVGMSLTISDDIHLETKTIVAVTIGSGRRLVGRRLTVGSVTLDTALENPYAAAAFVVAVPQKERPTKAPSTTTVTTTRTELIDAADHANPAIMMVVAMQICIAWSSRVVA